MTDVVKPFTILNGEEDADVCGPDGCIIPAAGSGLKQEPSEPLAESDQPA